MNNKDIIDSYEQLAYEIRIQVMKVQDEVIKASRDGYLGDLYRTDFTVSGRGAFPIDMLRYCNAWPKDEPDSGIIERSHDSDIASIDGPFTLQLTKYHRDPTPNLAEDRWGSKFRWKILGEHTRTVKL